VTWFFAVLVVLLMGACAVVAAGLGGSMSETYDDRPDARVQAEGPLTAEDIRRVRFSTAFRGYRMSEVDTLLARLADELEIAREERARGRHEAAAFEPDPGGDGAGGGGRSAESEADR
jgi:DivIVA domain-containing protein